MTYQSVVMPPRKKEIIDAINKLKKGKTAGPDQIPPEALKADASMTADQISGMMVSFQKTGKKATW